MTDVSPFVRHAIAMRRDTRDKLSTFAKTLGVSQAEVISGLIDFVSDTELQDAFYQTIEKRRAAKRVLVESRNDLLDALEGLSPEEVKRLLSAGR